MTFSRAKPAGFQDGFTLNASEMNTIDVNQSRALDGVGGSDAVPYAPSTAIEIAGAGLKVHGPFVVGSTITLDPGRTYSRPVNEIKWVIGSSTMDVVRLTVPFDASAASPINCVPDGATITGLSVQIDPANDGLLASTPAQLSLGRRAAGSGSAITTNIGSFSSDASASDAEHSITHTLSPAQVIDLTTYEYFVVVRGEQDTDKANLDWLSSRVSFSLTTVPLA